MEFNGIVAVSLPNTGYALPKITCGLCERFKCFETVCVPHGFVAVSLPDCCTFKQKHGETYDS